MKEFLKDFIVKYIEAGSNLTILIIIAEEDFGLISSLIHILILHYMGSTIIHHSFVGL